MRDYERRRSRDRDRDRDWDRDSRHERRERDDRDERRYRDRSHSRDRDRNRRSSHRDDAHSSRGRWGDEADGDRRQSRDEYHDRRDGQGKSGSAARDAYMGNFAKGGKLFEDNGGLPVFNAGEIAAQQAQSMQLQTQDAQNSSQPWHQQQAAASYGQQDRWDDGNQQAYQAHEQYNSYGSEQHHSTASAPVQYTDAYTAYGSNLEAGLDGDLEAQDDAAATFNDYYRSAQAEMYEEEYDPLRDEDSDDDRGRGQDQRSSWQETPSSTIYVRGVPEDATEADFYTLLAAYPGLVQVRIASNSRTGTSKGFAFVEFNIVEAAQALMESDARDRLSINGRALTLDYSISQYGSRDVQASNLADWICTMCQAVNFARRLECHQCSTKRAADAPRVDSQRAGPSDVLKVSGIEPQTTAETLQSLVAHIVAVKDVRLIRDKFTGQPRGFGFMEFNSVQDAARALQLLQNARVEGQQSVLKPSYAKQRAVASGPVPAAGEAAQAMSAYSDWAPPQYQEVEQQAQPAASASAGTQQAADAAHDSAAPAGGQAAAENGTAATSGFTYDSNSGYYYDPGSGYYYDANTGLYFNSSSQQWLALDPETGQFSVPQPANAVSSAAESTIAATNAAVEQAWVQQHSLADLQAPEIAYQAKAAPAKKRGAVIGSAAKLSSEGLMAAAKLAKEKEEQRRAQSKQEEDQKRREARQAAKKQQQQLLQQRQQQLRQMAPSGAAAGQQPVVDAAAAPSGVVRGVIRSSGKWTKPADA